MMRGLSLPVLLLAAALLATLAGARAVQAQASEEVPTPVLELLRAGVEARVRGDDATALEAFERAHALAPSLGRASAQLGLVHHALGHWLEAERLLDAALASDDPWIGRNRHAIEDSLEVVRTHLATLEVHAPDGAEILLDDELTGAPAPRTIRVAEGTHRLRARLAGREDAEASLDARGGRTELATLLPRALPEVATIEPAVSEPPEHDTAASAATAAIPDDAPSQEVSALVWVGIATALVGLGGAIGGHLVAEDARSQRAATLLSECTSATAACVARREALSAELAPFEVVVNLAWGLTALGGVLSGLGLGLTLSAESASGARVRLTPSGLGVRF